MNQRTLGMLLGILLTASPAFGPSCLPSARSSRW
jgi:hypothetical protein